MTGWTQVIDKRLDDIDREQRWRSPTVFDAFGPVGTLLTPQIGRADGQPSNSLDEIISFASNDYLGLSTHPVVCAAAQDAIDRWGTGARGSRLLTGTRPIHKLLEQELASWKHTQATTLFPTGYSANLGVMTVLGELGATIYSDELNHASIIDGCRLSKCKVSVYRHNDISQLDKMLSRDQMVKSSNLNLALGSSRGNLPVIVSDVVFSMDGDIARLEELAELSVRHNALLVLDEAHNVFNVEIEELELRDLTVIRVGTLSKTLGSTGGFVASSTSIINLLENIARPYIFSTALAPSSAAAALAALDIYRSSEGTQAKDTLASYIEQVLPGHKSPIIPVVLGSEADAIEISHKLLEEGMWIPAIRPPSVPKGTSRLRVTLSSSHTPNQIDKLSRAIETFAGPVRLLTKTPAQRPAQRPDQQPDHISRPISSSTRDASATNLYIHEDSRPSTVIFVAGVGTEVGKTWIASRLLTTLRRESLKVAARKPAESYEPDGNLSLRDSAVLAEASGELNTQVCLERRSYPLPMAPPMASEALGLSPFTIDDLIDELRWPTPPVDIGIVEIAGGVCSPQASDGDGVRLAKVLRPDITLLVTNSGLGCINAVRSSISAILTAVSTQSIIVVLNSFNPKSHLHVANASWLIEKNYLKVVTVLDNATELSDLKDQIQLILNEQKVLKA